MPAPFAIPPTTNPPASATAIFGPESVVRIALAAAAPPVGGEPAAAARTPASILSSGRWTPITPVERTTTSSGCKPELGGHGCRCLGSASPARPVAAFATPALIDHRLRLGDLEMAPRDRHRSCLHPVRVHIAAPTAGARANERHVGGPEGRMPAVTPLRRTLWRR